MRARKEFRKSIKYLVGGTVLSLSAMAPLTSYAGIYQFTVNTSQDTNDAFKGDGVCADIAGLCSLRAAVEEGNALSALSSSHHTMVKLKHRHLTLTNSSQENSTALQVTGRITLEGDGNHNTTIAKGGDHVSRVIEVVDGGNLSLKSISVTNGFFLGDDTRESCGGGILISTDSKLSGVRLRVHHNEALRAHGGGICNYGVLELFHSDVSLNISTDVSVGNPQILGGGGIFNTGSAVIHNSSLRENSASIGGAVFNRAIPGKNSAGGKMGGLKLSSSSIHNNVADIGGAAIYSFYSNLSLLNSTVVGNSLSDGNISQGTNGAISIEQTMPFSWDGDTPNIAVGGGIFATACADCHTNNPIDASQYSFESLTTKIAITMNYFRDFNCEPIDCAAHVATYLIEQTGEGDENAPFYDLPEATIWGSIIVQNYKQDSDGFLFLSRNCTTNKAQFSSKSGYNVWGGNTQDCDGINTESSIFIDNSILEEKLEFNVTQLTRHALRGFQDMWPDASNLWLLYGASSGVEAVLLTDEYEHLFPDFVPGVCPEYATAGCKRVLDLDGTLMWKENTGPYTPGSFQKR